MHSMTQDPEHDQQRTDYIAGLRQLADLLESTPTLPIPDDRDVCWYLFGSDAVTGEKRHTDDEQRALAAQFVRMLPGEQRKQETGHLFRFRGQVGGITTQVIVDREAVCRRVVKGTETVDLPAVEAQPARTETREVIEWVCEPLLTEAVPA